MTEQFGDLNHVKGIKAGADVPCCIVDTTYHDAPIDVAFKDGTTRVVMIWLDWILFVSSGFTGRPFLVREFTTEKSDGLPVGNQCNCLQACRGTPELSLPVIIAAATHC